MSENFIDNILSDLLSNSLSLSDNPLPETNPIPTNVNSDNMALNGPQISVRDYLELIPRFDGDTSQLSNFLNACENVLTLMAPNNEIPRISFTLLHIRTKIVGKAATLLASRNYRSFPELKGILLSIFGDQRNEESLLSDLTILRQKSNESCLQFADRCVNLRSLLLDKISCSELPIEIKNTKLEMYNAMTLRSFLTGLNGNMSHLLRCKSPNSIEEAIHMVTEEENINYHRQQLSTPNNLSTSRNNPQFKVADLPVRPISQFQRQIPQAQARTSHPVQHKQFQFPVQPKQFQIPAQQRQFYTQPKFPSQPTNIQSIPIKHNFPTNRQTFGPPQNVFKPSNKPVIRNYEPMDTSSRLTQLRSSQQRQFPQQNQARKYYSQELNAHEVLPEDEPPEEASFSPYDEDTLSYEEYLELQNQNYQEENYTDEQNDEENFQKSASGTSKQ